MITTLAWLLLWVDPGWGDARVAGIVPGALRRTLGAWAVPLRGRSPEEVLAACLAAGVLVRRSAVCRRAGVEVPGHAA